MPPIYPTLAVASAVAVVLVEWRLLRTGIFRDAAYWISMAICIGFMIPVDGWLTKHSAPIVIYRPSDTSELYPIWNILAEEYLYAFALLTLTMACWDRLGRRPGGTDTESANAAPSDASSPAPQDAPA